jgi:hypothetical protein
MDTNNARCSVVEVESGVRGERGFKGLGMDGYGFPG